MRPNTLQDRRLGPIYATPSSGNSEEASSMVKLLRSKPAVRIPALALIPRTAEELMTPNPISIPEASTVRRAADFLLKHHFSAAPVIDTAGRAVGVVSITDLLRKRERTGSPEYY